MFEKREFKEERRRLRKDIGEQLWRLRHDKGLTISDLAILTKKPIHRLESLELEGLTKLHIYDLQWLASFYNKYVKIELVDKEKL